MDRNNQRIMTINAKSLFKYFPKKEDDKTPFCFDTRKRSLYTLVVKEETELEECPMLHQFLEVLKSDDSKKKSITDNEYLLYDQFLIMDFDNIFLPIDEHTSEAVRKRRERQQKNVKELMENGFDLRFEDYTIHMMPFDKSGNMSRNGRISFVNAIYIKQLNERLNLGMDFSEIKVKLSKYYAYRGLYLSTSKRVEHEKFMLTPETLVVVKDVRMKKGNDKVVGGTSFERDVTIATAIPGETPGDWNFQESDKKDIYVTDIPYDGTGFIVPEYSAYINETLKLCGANSFQIRLPFAKGMLHQVDVLQFIDEFTKEGKGDKQYIYEDAFGRERDLSKARIFLTESMFKGKKWLETYCEKHEIDDPMEYYCDKIAEFKHGFYVSGTNLPYGHSKYTHLSYQTINTLAFEQEQFERIIKGHGKYIDNPVEFIKEWDELENEDVSKEDGDISCRLPNWKRALIQNPALVGDNYIGEQLENIQKSLLSKIALGKILVEGQTRYLCRDLFPLLSSLLRNEQDIKGLYLYALYSRFYMPMGKDNESSKLKLEFDKEYAFFRNPHLSRNEQYLMRAFVLPNSENEYANDGRKDYKHYVKYVEMYNKYFGHLTGIVMIPRGSTLPLCLGGADFDGDLVSVIFNQDVVDAVKNGVYEEQPSPSLNWWKRILPIIEIPSGADVEEETVPDYVQYQHIYNTFSNHIGRISNAAISIGQIEYARDSQYVEEFDADKASCAKCTLLTGLEIDAAKNGLHPNLNLILNNMIKKSEYLTFLKQFKELKAEENFHLDRLEIKEEKVLVKGGGKRVIIGAKNCETKVEWNPATEDTGTYINLLPKYFLQYYAQYEELKSKATKFEFKNKKELSEPEENVVKYFEESCGDILKLYDFYKKTFLKRLAKEKNKGYYAVENAEVIIGHMYDEIQADEMLFKTLPELRRKIEDAIPEDSAIKDIRERINTLQWQFQPRSKRSQVLEQIIGNEFSLEESEEELLYHFNQQGYKMLWCLMDLIEGPRNLSYEEVCEAIKEEKEKALTSVDFGKLQSLLDKDLDGMMREYYTHNMANAAEALYHRCLKALKEEIGIYSGSIKDISILQVALYEKTRSKNARFFWEAFSWEDMKELIGGEADEKC